MKESEVLQLVRPECLVAITKPIKASAGNTLVEPGLYGARAWLLDSWGAEIALFSGPRDRRAIATVTPRDLEDKCRPATADEERSWIARAEREET